MAMPPLLCLPKKLLPTTTLIYVVTKSSSVHILPPIRSSGSTEGALEEAGQAELHMITEAAPNELKLREGA